MINTIYVHVRDKPRKGYLFALFPKLGTISPYSRIQQLARQHSEFHNFYIVNYGTGCPEELVLNPQNTLKAGSENKKISERKSKL